MADKQYDVSPQELKNLEIRAKKRAALRAEFLKQVNNPHRHATMEGGHLFDPAVQRFLSMRVTGYDHFKPNPKTALYGMAMCIIPMVAFTWLIKWQRDSKEHLFRTGQVSYRDRNFKFI